MHDITKWTPAQLDIKKMSKDELENFIHVMFYQIKQARDLLTEDDISTRHSIYPSNDMFAIEATMQLEADGWSAHELSYIDDRENFWTILNDDEREIVRIVIGFLHFADGLFADEILLKMQCIETSPERQRYFIAQAEQERFHAEAYELMLFGLFPCPNERKAIRERVLNSRSLKKIVAFIEETISCTNRFECYLRNSICEFLFFTPQFGSIYWLKNNRGNALPNFFATNGFVIHDEGAHCRTNAEFYRIASDDEKPSHEFATTLVERALSILEEFIEENYANLNIIGLGVYDLTNYSKIIANTLYQLLGIKKEYEVTNTLPFMNTMALQPKINHYENRNTEYSKYNVSVRADYLRTLGHDNVDLDDDSSDDDLPEGAAIF